jgi:predicted ATPase
MDLIQLPTVTDRTQLAIATILNKCLTAAFFTDNNLPLFISAKVALLSMNHGNSTYSCFAYVFLGTLEKSKYNNFDHVVEWGKLGLDLCEQYCNIEVIADRGQVWDLFGGDALPLNF